MDTNTLQELINKKAEEKLEKDLNNLHQLLSKQVLFSGHGQGNKSIPQILVFNPQRTGETKHTAVFPSALLSSHNVFSQQLKDYWLPVYTTRETEAFVREVQELSERVNDLSQVTFTSNDY